MMVEVQKNGEPRDGIIIVNTLMVGKLSVERQCSTQDDGVENLSCGGHIDIYGVTDLMLAA